MSLESMLLVSVDTCGGAWVVGSVGGNGEDGGISPCDALAAAAASLGRELSGGSFVGCGFVCATLAAAASGLFASVNPSSKTRCGGCADEPGDSVAGDGPPLSTDADAYSAAQLSARKQPSLAAQWFAATFVGHGLLAKHRPVTAT